MPASLPIVALAVVLGWGSAPDEGQGTAQPGANLAQLEAGKLIYGVDARPEDWRGQVVVVNIGGG